MGDKTYRLSRFTSCDILWRAPWCWPRFIRDNIQHMHAKQKIYREESSGAYLHTYLLISPLICLHNYSSVDMFLLISCTKHVRSRLHPRLLCDIAQKPPINILKYVPCNKQPPGSNPQLNPLQCWIPVPASLPSGFIFLARCVDWLAWDSNWSGNLLSLLTGLLFLCILRVRHTVLLFGIRHVRFSWYTTDVTTRDGVDDIVRREDNRRMDWQ